MNKKITVSDMDEQSQRFALLALFMGALAISFAAIFVRLSDLGPTSSGFYRTILAVPLFLVWPFLMPKSASLVKSTHSRSGAILLVLAGVFFAGDLAFWHYSIGLTSIANATLFPNLAPIFVTFVAWYLFKEQITQRFLLGLGAATVGAVIVLGDSLLRGEGHIKGDLLAFVAALFYAGYLLSISRLRQTHTTLSIMLWSSLVTSLVLLPICIFSGQSLVPGGINGWLVLFALSWISHAGGQGLIAYALAHLPVSFSSVGLLVQPAMAAFFAFLILGEPIGLWQGIGAVVILGGIYLARRGSTPSTS